MRVDRLRPAVDARILILVAGLLWLLVGTGLSAFALSRLTLDASGLLYIGVAVGLSAVIQYFGFSRIVRKNILRLQAMRAKVCVFAFQGWRSYSLVGIMMGLGYVLRRLPMPGPYLALLYLTMGLALVFSSVRYFSAFALALRS